MSEGKHVYRWSWDCGRMGDLHGLFVATEKSIADAIGKDAYFGEVLGKHSDVHGKLGEKEFEVLSSDPAVIAFVEEHGPFGHNPLSYISYECDECGEPSNPDECVIYRCGECDDMIICSTDSCARIHAEHQGLVEIF